jgi:hypothetical protein
MCDDRQHEVWGGIGHANGDPEVIGNDDTDVVLHKNKQLYPPLVIVPGMLLPQLLSDVLPQPRIAQTKQGHIDWPIDPALEQMAAMPEGASVHPGTNAVATLVLNTAVPQGGHATLPLQVGAPPHMNIPVCQHDPNNMVVQPVHQSLPNASIQLGDQANLGIPRGAESVVNGAVHQGGPVTQGLQQASHSVQNMPLKQGGPAS